MNDPYQALALSPFRRYSKAEVRAQADSLRRKNLINDVSAQELEEFVDQIASGSAKDDAVEKARAEFTRLSPAFVFVRLDGTRVILDRSVDPLMKRMAAHKWCVSKEDLPELTHIPVEPTSAHVLNPKLVGALDALEGKPLADWTNDAIDVLNRNGGSLGSLGSAPSDAAVKNIFSDMEKLLDNLMAQRRCMELGKGFRRVRPCIDDPAMLADLKRWSVLWPLTKDVKGASVSGRIERHVFEALIRENALARTGANTSDALIALESYCMGAGIVADFSLDRKATVTCPSCGAYMQSDIDCCTICGASLYFRCSCGARTPSSGMRCSGCGADISLVSDPKKAEETIARLTDEGMVDDLKAFLRSVEGIRSKIGRQAMDRAEALVSEFESISTKVQKLEKEGKVFGAVAAADGFLSSRKSSAGLQRVADCRERCRRACDEANRMVANAAGLPNDKAAAECRRIAALYPDCAAALDMMRKLTPDRPAQVILSDGKDGHVRIEIVPGANPGSSYLIVRNPAHAPMDCSDGEVLRAASNEFVDKVTSGVGYFYAVYGDNGGILSEPFRSARFAVFSGVTGVRAVSEGGGIRISYDAPEGCDAVLLWKAENSVPGPDGAGTDIGKSGFYMDTDVGEGRTFGYLLAAVYSSGRSAPVVSPGAGITCTRTRNPDPPANFRVESMGGGEFQAHWDCTCSCDLYISSAKLGPGRTVPAEHLMERASPLDADTSSGNARFRLPEGTVAYVFPVLFAGSTAVLGQQALVSNTRPPEVSCRPSRGGFNVSVGRWPVNAQEVVICCRGDRFPTDQSDGDRITVAPGGAPEVHFASSADRAYVAAFARYPEGLLSEPSFADTVRAGERTVVEYRKVEHLTRTTIEFRVSGNVAEIPRTEIRVSQYGRPRPSDTLVAIIDKVRVAGGKGSVTLPSKTASEIGRNKGYALFFADPSDYESYDLKKH